MNKFYTHLDIPIQFISAPPEVGHIYMASYRTIWVVISVLLSILASYAALKASSRIESQKDFRSKLIWMMISALTLGIGIWTMHFIGMLAVNLPCSISYNPFVTVISMFPAILSSGVALGIVRRSGKKPISVFARSILLGAGIGLMHYSGMAAMHLDGEIHYDFTLFAVSILVAVALSYIALLVKDGLIDRRKWRDVIVATIIGIAVSGMHYTAMRAAYFVHEGVGNDSFPGITSDTLAILIAVTSIFLILTVLTLASFSRIQDMTRQFQESEERWKFALEGSGDGVWDWNLQTDESLFSKRWKEMIGYSEHEFPNTGSAWINHLHNDDKSRVLSAFQQYLASNEPNYSVEFRLRCKDGSWKWILSKGKLVSRNTDGNPMRFIGTHTDITASKQAEIELRIAATAFDSQEGIIITDANRLILRVNHAFTEITGYSSEEVMGRNPKILSSGHHSAEFFSHMWSQINETGSWEGEIWNRRKDGKTYPQHLTITAIVDLEGSITNYVATLTDITMSKAAADEIQRLAFYDPLTGLPNRQLLRDRLKLAQASSHRSGCLASMLFIDMDNFKTLNDTLGHDVGDLLLQNVAKRLISCVREGDTVARLGGDEFVVVLEDLDKVAFEAVVQTEAIGHKILAVLDEPYQLASYEYRSTPSIGATLINGHDQTIDELLKQADIAMYQAKTSGRNTLRFFDPQMQISIAARLSMETDLSLALQEDQFSLFYQPQVNTQLEIIGAEVLLRWNHPVRGMVSPADFIPLAEETGLIVPIGQWVLETTCNQIKAWENILAMQHVQLAVNVSAYQFRQSEFVEHVSQILNKTAINPNKLKLELTETLVLHDIDDTILKMNALKKIGVQFSMDDFGTGYSSLSSLKKLPIDQLKIDQSFVHDLPDDQDDSIIVETIIAMANHLGMEVIAEGVETESQRQFLEKHGCFFYQGYLFGKPAPLAELELQQIADSQNALV